MSLAQQLVEEFARAELTLATAESLTAGLVSAGIADVPGASSVLRGGAVTYATECKARVLGVDAELLAARGAVDAQVAQEMALGARRLFGADVAVATTGVAGPAEQDGNPVGTVYVSVVRTSPHERSGRAGELSDRQVCCYGRGYSFTGDRQAIRRASVEAAWQFCLDVLRDDAGAPQAVVSASL